MLSIMQRPVVSNSCSPPTSPYSPHSSYSNGNSPGMIASPGSNFHGPVLVPSRLVNRVPPYLTILNQPQGKFRFRYVSEMTGTHGCLMAESKDRNKKEYIRVQLEGCPEKEAIIRCTLVTNNTSNPFPHVHRLGGDGNPNGNEGQHQDITVSAHKNEWTATFSGLTIIHTAKKQVREVVEKQLLEEKKHEKLNRAQQQQLKDEADKIASTMDLHSVRLKFETFVERNGLLIPITEPELSQPIHNLKSTHAGDLRIVRIDKVFGCCTGQEEIFIFVEKVNKKDIKIRFFEMDESDNELWTAFADFSELDVHHQYAIAFKTPPYQNQNIQNDVVVQFQLYRPSNGSTSESKSFTYTPREFFRPHPHKRPRTEVTSHPNSPHFPNRTGNFFPSPSHNENSSNSNDTQGGQSPFFTSRNNGNSPQDVSSSSSSGHQLGNNQQLGPIGFNFTPPSMQTIDLQPIAWNVPTLPSQPQVPSQQQLVQSVQQHHVTHQTAMMNNLPMDQSGSLQNNGQNQARFHVPMDNNRPEPMSIVNNWNAYSDDILRMVVESSIHAPAVQQLEGNNVAFSEVIPEHNDDDLLRMFSSLPDMDEWGSDATAGSVSACLERVHISTNNENVTPIKEAIKPKGPTVARTPAALMSTYSINMARALRWYAETGDLAHILMRMRHLMAIQSDDGDNALHDALFHNQIEAVRAMLKAASCNDNGLTFIDSQNNSNVAPLHISVKKNQAEATALLLQNGANPNVVDANGNTPLHLAAADKHLVDCLQLLLGFPSRKPGLKLDTRNYAGLTPLLIAVSEGNARSVELLLARGADVNCFETKRGRTALHLAIKKRAMDVVLLLLKNPHIDVNAESYDGSTALHLAVVDELEDMCATLMDHGADPSASNYVGPFVSSDSEDSEQSDDDNGEEGEDERLGRSPIDLAQTNHSILDILLGNYQRVVISTGEDVELEACTKNVPSEKPCQNRGIDSGFDLMASKDLSKDMDSRIIADLAKLLDTPGKEWERLAKSLDLGALECIFSKVSNPAVYLLENLNAWDISTQNVLEKLHELKLHKAAAVLEDFLLR